MSETPARGRPFQANFQSNLIAGLLTVTPLIIVWLVFDFFLETLSQWGHPLAVQLTDFLDIHFPMLKPWLDNDTVRWLIGVAVALLTLYSIGAVASRVLGQRLIHFFERLITRIPLVETIYSAAKKLVDVLRQKPGANTQRVVLIEFPSPGLRAVGFVMRTFPDARTGEELAAVYVPTAPNPTSGYLQIVPLASLLPTDMKGDEAMTMILSGGAVTPDHVSIAAKS
ncbi:MAG TPA: DUF502 domain-containing protein [Rhizomicrobium sp.]|jgi:uncharacterized membrane protein|nr:DUF502 domain-containing protein [Rhizomicrobium sp.]